MCKNWSFLDCDNYWAWTTTMRQGREHNGQQQQLLLLPAQQLSSSSSSNTTNNNNNNNMWLKPARAADVALPRPNVPKAAAAAAAASLAKRRRNLAQCGFGVRSVWSWSRSIANITIDRASREWLWMCECVSEWVIVSNIIQCARINDRNKRKIINKKAQGKVSQCTANASAAGVVPSSSCSQLLQLLPYPYSYPVNRSGLPAMLSAVKDKLALPLPLLLVGLLAALSCK